MPRPLLLLGVLACPAMAESVLAPERRPGVELSTTVRAVPNTGFPSLIGGGGRSGFGFMVDASVTWRTEAPWALRARVTPLGAAWGRYSNDGVGLVGGQIDGWFDHRYFAIGVGFSPGVALFGRSTAPLGGAPEPHSLWEFQFLPLIRLGAEEGLNLTAQLRLGVGTEPVFGQQSGLALRLRGAEVGLQVPVGRGWRLLLRAFQLLTHTFAAAEIGLRFPLLRERLADRLGVTITAGLGGITQSIGLTFGLGVAWRI